MEAINSKDFLEKLNSGSLHSTAHIIGKAKKGEKKDEILFAFKAKHLDWIAIPGSMIEHAHIIKTFKMDGEDVCFVKMKLVEPENKEAKILYNILRVAGEKIMEMWLGHEGGSGFGMHSHSCGCHH
jgi:hypothetical protein